LASIRRQLSAPLHRHWTPVSAGAHQQQQQQQQQVSLELRHRRHYSRITPAAKYSGAEIARLEDDQSMART